MRCKAGSRASFPPVPDRIHVKSKIGYENVPKEVLDTEEGNFKLHSSAQIPRALSFWLWCSGLLKMVLRSRTPFAAFLLSTLHLQRGDSASASPLFPVPVPWCGIFDRMPSGLSLRARRRLHMLRAVHILVMALNYWHGGLGAFPNESLLTRCPSKAHVLIYKRLKGILAADGPASGSFEILVSGRKFLQLVARLGELSDQLTYLGASGPYGRMFPGVEVPTDNLVVPQLQPYRDLNAQRL